ncbi:MAG: hypothetical protein NVSMB14_07700 [Isosphaeraceae bacterium]
MTWTGGKGCWLKEEFLANNQPFANRWKGMLGAAPCRRFPFTNIWLRPGL